MPKIKFLVLLSGLAFVAASCNLFSDTLGFASGEKGVFKSDDAGRSFRPFNKVGKKDSLAGTSVNSLDMDPRNPDIMYLGSSGGVYKSEDGGNSWRHILAGMTVADIAIDPYKSEVVYASGISSSKGKIIRTTDGGASWIDIYTEPTSSNAVTGIAVGRFNPLLLVAALGTGEIIRSTDEGLSWAPSTDLQGQMSTVVSGPGNSFYALSKNKGLFKSSDNGLTWIHLTSSLANTNFTNFSSPSSAVTDFFSFVLDQKQSGVLYLGTEQGLVRSVNDGANWSFMDMPVKNKLLRVTAAGVNPSNSNNIYAVVGSTMFKSLNGGVTWETRELPTGQETRIILIHPETTNIIYLGLGNRK